MVGRASLALLSLLLAGFFHVPGVNARPVDILEEAWTDGVELPLAVRPEDVAPRMLLQGGLSYPSFPGAYPSAYPPPPPEGTDETDGEGQPPEPPTDDETDDEGQPPEPPTSDEETDDEGEPPEPPTDEEEEDTEEEQEDTEDTEEEQEPDEPRRNPNAPGRNERYARVSVQANDEPTAIQVAGEARSFLSGRGGARKLLNAEDIILGLEQEAEASSSVEGVDARVFAVSRDGRTLSFDLRLNYPEGTSSDDIESDAQRTRSSLNNQITSSTSRLNSLFSSAGLDPSSASVEEGPAMQRWVAPEGTEYTRDTNVTLTPQNVNEVDNALDAYLEQQASSRRRLLGVSEFVTELNSIDFEGTASLVAYSVLDNDDITLVIRLSYPSDFTQEEIDADVLDFQAAVNDNLRERAGSLKAAFAFNAQWQQLQLMFEPAAGAGASSSGACSSRAGFGVLAVLALLAAVFI